MPRVLLSCLLVLGVCLFGSCARAPRPAADVSPPATPEPASKALASTSDVRLLKDAQDHQNRGDYPSAIRILQNFLQAQPESPLLLEAQVALARTYEQSGDLQAALQAYREVVKRTSAQAPGRFRPQARERIAFLEARTELGQKAIRRPVGVMVSASLVPPQAQWDQWLGELKKAGVTSVILEVGTKPPLQTGSSNHTQETTKKKSRENAPGVFFQTTRAPVKQALLNQIVPLAHKKGIMVFGGVTLRRMPWLAPPAGWADWVYRLNVNRLERSSALDIFNPAVQDYHQGFLADLVKSGIDGIVFQADAPMGPFDGLTRFGLEGFRRQYGMQLNARTLFPPQARSSRPIPSSRSSSKSSVQPPVKSRFSPAYWKWEGWKVREQLHVMGRYMSNLRKQRPALQFAVEVHAEAISKPVDALLQYSEDLLETKQLGFHYLMTPLGVSGEEPMSLSQRTSSESESAGASETHFMNQALAIMEGPERIWVMRKLSHGNVATVGQAIPVRMDQLPFPKGVGLLYTLENPVLP